MALDVRQERGPHPFRVAMTVRQLFKIDDKAILCGAVLHDTIEDTTTDFDDVVWEFGRRSPTSRPPRGRSASSSWPTSSTISPTPRTPSCYKFGSLVASRDGAHRMQRAEVLQAVFNS